MQMQHVLDDVAAEVAPLVAAAGRPRRVACLEWNDPLMGCGHWCAPAVSTFDNPKPLLANLDWKDHPMGCSHVSEYSQLQHIGGVPQGGNPTSCASIQFLPLA